MPGSTFSSGGKDYEITIYPARRDGKKYPILLLLHGNSGLVEPYARQIQGFAQSLAGFPSAVPGLGDIGLGYVTAVPSYYSAAGDHTADQDPGPHLDTLAEAIRHVSAVAGADPGRIGLIGYSLGARIAMTYIARNPGKIKVLADYFGPIKPRAPEGPVAAAIAAGIGGFPPTITFHDVRDVIVPVDRSVELHSLLPTGVEHQLNIYATEPVQLPSDPPQQAGDAPLVGNHAFKESGYADVASRSAAANWIVKHMPPTGV